MEDEVLDFGKGGVMITVAGIRKSVNKEPVLILRLEGEVRDVNGLVSLLDKRFGNDGYRVLTQYGPFCTLDDKKDLKVLAQTQIVKEKQE